jgi:hypothetical protein
MIYRDWVPPRRRECFVDRICDSQVVNDGDANDWWITTRGVNCG